MQEGPRRRLRRACWAASAACGLLFVALPALAQDAPATPKPAVWHGSAQADGLTFEVDRDALLPVPNALRFTALQGTSTYDTDLQTARASILFPGEGVLQGPNLACGTFGSSAPPEFDPLIDLCATYDYPLSVFADASTPTKSTGGSVRLGKPTDPISTEAVSASVRADVDAATSDAVIGDLRVLGLPTFDVIPLLPVQDLTLDPTIARVESATSRTAQRIDDEGTLVVESKVTMQGVRLVGGLIRIGSIISTAAVTDDGEGERTADGSFEMSGVTVAGVPARITDDGLVLGSPAGSGPLGQQLSQAVQQLVEGLGVRISLLTGEETTDDGTGTAVASGGGLLLEVGLNVDGAPTVPGPVGDIDPNGTYVGTVQLGFTAASGGASATFDDGDGFVAAPDGEVPLPDLGTGSVGELPLPDLGAGAPATPSAPSARVGRPVAPVARTAGPDLFGGRLELLYLAFAFAVLALCVAPRLTLPARLPGPRA